MTEEDTTDLHLHHKEEDIKTIGNNKKKRTQQIPLT
jgi:hypothetical protein